METSIETRRTETRRKLESVFDKKRATVLSEVITDAYRDLVKTSDFNELKDIVRDLGIKVGDLAEAQKRTELRVEELAGAQKELTEAQKRTEVSVRCGVCSGLVCRHSALEVASTSMTRLSRSNGLLTYADAPKLIACSTVSELSHAVMIIMGTFRLRRRFWPSAVSPSIFGRMRSRSTTSNLSSLTFSTAWTPSWTATTAYPFLESLAPRMRQRLTSSSTTRTLPLLNITTNASTLVP